MLLAEWIVSVDDMGVLVLTHPVQRPNAVSYRKGTHFEVFTLASVPRFDASCFGVINVERRLDHPFNALSVIGTFTRMP